MKLKGTYTALATPFKEDLNVDFQALKILIEKQISGQVSGIVILGSTGEAQTLSLKEKFEIVNKVHEYVDGRIPIIVGTGSNDTNATIDFTRSMKEYNVSAVLIVVPYYNKPSQEGMLKHYTAINDAVDIPFIVYNVPGRTGVNLLPKTTISIANNCNNAVGVKEASGSMEQILEIIKGVPNHFKVLSGDDSLTIPAIYMGGSGVISTISNYAPKMFSEAVRLALAGNISQANKLHYRLLEMMQINFIETNPVPVKAIMKELGIIPTNFVRMPLLPISDHNLKTIQTILNNKEIY